MLLRSLRLENFRAVKSAEISFDPTTVLIGENDCGRSSVMEAIALALGWNPNDDEFLFQPIHIHRSVHQASSVTPSLSIALEFCESAPGEWNGEGFEILRDALPDVLSRHRRFWFEIALICSTA
jgi:putative ATP-dependent endonuclease of the OLD family